MRSTLDFTEVSRAKSDWLSGGAPDFHGNTALLASWERSRAAIGSPDLVRDIPIVDERELDQPLLETFFAPLARFGQHLEGTGVALLLADPRGRIIQRWASDRTSDLHLDHFGTVRGANLSEEAVGTNAVGTVVATGLPFIVEGPEHFIEKYENAACAGAPIRHPMSGALMGVITLSSDLTARADLLQPMLRNLAEQLEKHVLDLSLPGARRLFDLFLKLTRISSVPVLAFSPNEVVMQNGAARALPPRDIELIREAQRDEIHDGRFSLELSYGVADVEVISIDAENQVLVMSDVPHAPLRALTQPVARAVAPAPGLVQRSETMRQLIQKADGLREAGVPFVVGGESGTGKASIALGTPFEPGMARLGGALVNAGESLVAGEQQWLNRLRDRLDRGEPSVVRGLDCLAASALSGLRAIVESHGGGPLLAFTTVSHRIEDVERMAHRLGCAPLWVPPLRERTDDLQPLWDHFVATVTSGSTTRPSKEAAAVLAKHGWPGNVTELRSLVVLLVLAARSDVIELADLPLEMRVAKSLNRIERAELAVLKTALAEAGGNRVKTAKLVGVSRATIYRRLRAYDLITD